MTSKAKIEIYPPYLNGAPAEDGNYYPETDGRPMADSQHQADAMAYMYTALKEWFRDREDVVVAEDLLLYYNERGESPLSVAPDVFVVFGAASRHKRENWIVWREGYLMPRFVMEVGSPTTFRRDERFKRELYAKLGVEEYWRFDAMDGKLFEPVLVGERLVNGEYEPMDVYEDSDGVLRGYSAALGLDLCVVDAGELRFYNPLGREWLRSLSESEDDRRAEAEARQRAEAARAAAEEELRRLRELLARADSGE